MNLQIHVTDLVMSDAMREHLERRIQFALSRFGDQVRRVNVHIWHRDAVQEGGHNGCRIEVAVQNVGIIAADDMHPDAYEAIDVSIERVGRAVGRALSHLRSDNRFKRTA